MPMGEIKGKFNYRVFLIDPQIFTQIFDRPYLRKGADIRTLSSPDARGPAPYKFALSENFCTGTLKGSNLRGKIFKFRKNSISRVTYGGPQFLFQGVQHDVQTGLYANF